MMINKRLINTVKERKKYIAGNVICQWLSLAVNITMMVAIAGMLQNLFEETTGDDQIAMTAVVRIDLDFLHHRTLRHDFGSVSHCTHSSPSDFHRTGFLLGNSHFSVSQEVALNIKKRFRT